MSKGVLKGVSKGLVRVFQHRRRGCGKGERRRAWVSEVGIEICQPRSAGAAGGGRGRARPSVFGAVPKAVGG